MSEPRYKIVFDGELLPNMSLDTVKDNFARLFKLDPARVEPLFGRRAVVLKRDLSANDADKYLSVLERAGALVRKEQDLAASLTLAPTDEEKEEEAAAQPCETMRCPKCGHEQPKSGECSACGIIIEKYLARQAQQSQTGTNDGRVPAGSPSPYAPPQARVSEELPEFGELRPFTTDGRIGRLRYLAWSLVLAVAGAVLFAVAGIGMAIHVAVGSLLIAAASIALCVVAVMIGVQRLHDIGWSGWLLLLNLVPVVGSVFSLLMLLMPGSVGANRYGPPPPANSTAVKVLAALWLIPFAALLLALVFGGFAAITGMLPPV
ncbi:DUF805 domain-containing protein [Zestomonas thermotolerans]|uniref:DUF805 domain-containing protein n=1 Tax=Zestomonas thermotolerans TaxID=157784 RepID=UPI0023F3096E|nr:DUF805 domain-containing protein [Pseudomonas thermotolerans]